MNADINVSMFPKSVSVPSFASERATNTTPPIAVNTLPNLFHMLNLLYIHLTRNENESIPNKKHKIKVKRLEVLLKIEFEATLVCASA